jgi:hypothetical protein
MKASFFVYMRTNNKEIFYSYNTSSRNVIIFKVSMVKKNGVSYPFRLGGLYMPKSS